MTGPVPWRRNDECATNLRFSTPARGLLISTLPLRQQRNDTLYGRLGLCPQRGVVVVRDRVRDRHERVSGQSVQLGDHLSAALEAIGHDCDSGNAQPLGFNGVVQTARRATPQSPIADRIASAPPFNSAISSFDAGRLRQACGGE